MRWFAATTTQFVSASRIFYAVFCNYSVTIKDKESQDTIKTQHISIKMKNESSGIFNKLLSVLHFL